MMLLGLYGTLNDYKDIGMYQTIWMLIGVLFIGVAASLASV